MKLTLQDFLQKRSTVRPSYVFDLREKDEFEKDHLMGAHNLPLEFLEDNLHRLPFSGDLLFYGADDGGAAQAMETLEKSGFGDKYFVEEGYEAIKEVLKTSKFDIRLNCTGEDSREVKMEVIQNLLDFEINPMVAGHGGEFTLKDVDGNTVYVELGGGCQGCGMVDVTLRQGVEQRMREVFPDMVELVDNTDHAGGTDPFYQPGK